MEMFKEIDISNEHLLELKSVLKESVENEIEKNTLELKVVQTKHMKQIKQMNQNEKKEQRQYNSAFGPVKDLSKYVFGFQIRRDAFHFHPFVD